MALQLMVEQLKVNVLASYDSADNLVSSFDEQNADCLLMDIQLNGKMTGLQAVEELRKYSEVPVIFLSGDNSLELLSKIKSITNATFMSKPYTEANLKDKFIEMSLLG